MNLAAARRLFGAPQSLRGRRVHEANTAAAGEGLLDHPPALADAGILPPAPRGEVEMQAWMRVCRAQGKARPR